MYKEFEKVLCGDCLRVREYSAARHSEEEHCECGGQFCGCGFCMETANALNEGKRAAKEIGCQCDVGKWNEIDGVFAK